MTTAIAEGAIIAGKYRLERPLARGGMGSVWIARHLQLNAEVAIKLIIPERAASAEARMRFDREAKASAQLRTPNVVQIFDYGVDGETPYIVMERLEGEDLGARLERERRISAFALVTIVNQICRALRRAHEIGLVHRDLKPANIFLARQDGEEVVKILDFGIAKDTGLSFTGSATRTGSLLGSPYYMSPEQVRRSKDVDPRSDLWSLGVVLFQCLTGRLPHQSEEAGELLLAICSEDAPAASQVAPDLNSSVDPFFARALARSLGDRFQSAEELAAAFAAAVSGPLAQPRTPSQISSPNLQAGSHPSLTSEPRHAFQQSPASSRPSLSAGAQPPNLSGGTIPIASTLTSPVMPARRRPRIGLALSLLAGALVLGLVAWSLLRASTRAPAVQVETAASASKTPAVETNVAPGAAPPTAAPSEPAIATPPATSASAAPSPRPPSSAPKSTPPPPKRPKTPYDPTSHL